jgi:hypothetical protein
MATFSPPTDNFVSPVIAGEFMNGQYLAATERLANQWGKHVALSPRGRNVFLLTDTTITENQPSDASTISKIYYGGHQTEVTAEEVAALTAAGYGAYIT